MTECTADTILNMDCFDAMSSMQPESIDVVLTSPPYNMTKRKGGLSDSGRYDVYVDWMDYPQYIEYTINLFREFDRIVKPNGVVLYNFSYSIENPALPYQMTSEIISSTDWTLADTIIWEKSSGLPFPANQRRLSRKWEFVWVFVRKNEIDTFTTNRTEVTKGVNEQSYYDVRYNIISAENNDEPTPELNQATFSTDMAKQLLDIYVQKGGLVYDPFMGTGTTAVACKMLGLHYMGSEISENQCRYAEERIKGTKYAEQMKLQSFIRNLDEITEKRM